LFPALTLLANNIDQVKPSAAWRSLVISFIAGSLLLLVLRWMMKEWMRAGLLCSYALLLFFSYGHLNQLLKLSGPLGVSVARHRYMLPLWIILFVAGTWWILHRVRGLERPTLVLNATALILVLIPMFQIGEYAYRLNRAVASAVASESADERGRLSKVGGQPDIYYIVLDAYTRQDVLREVYDYDNEPFLRELTEMGFYVARCSQSNYAQTELSLASTFNMNYLDELGEAFVAGSDDRSGLWPLLQHGKVRSLLEDLGYKVVAFDSGFYWIMWMDADHYLSPSKRTTLKRWSQTRGMNDFELMFARSTGALLVIDAALKADVLDRILPIIEYKRQIWRDRTEFVFDQLDYEKVPSIQGPKFVYAHLILPHPPYVFGPDGEYVEEKLGDMDVEGYRNQVVFANKQLTTALKELIDRSAKDPIIVLQGDHGQGFDPLKRMAILNAYYLPDYDGPALYPEITPVNTFRLIFDTYFGADYGLVEDVSYFSTYADPYSYEVVPVSEGECLQ
jgi:hypothetical protein